MKKLAKICMSNITKLFYFQRTSALKFSVCVVLKILLLQDPAIRPLHELEKSNLEDILAEIPLWIKCPDYDRVSITFQSYYIELLLFPSLTAAKS